MKFSLLFWGFQDFNFVSDVVRKARSITGIKDFCIQIDDLEKTSSLMDLYPEEIIRTRYDLNNLYQWLVRCTKKNIIVIIDLFNFVFQDNVEENCLSLRKILELDFKVCFIAPKILHPQSESFINNVELNSIYHKTLEYTKTIKTLYEIIVNSGANTHIVASPIPHMVVLNRENYFLFEGKTKYKLNFSPKILKKFNADYISQSHFAAKLVEVLSSILLPEKQVVPLIADVIEPDCSAQQLVKNNLNSFKPTIFVSLERFFKVKSSTVELKFILWLMYMAICEYEVKAEKSLTGQPPLVETYFGHL